MSKEQPIEAEVIPQSQALAVRPEQQIQPGLFGTTEPATIITKATEVASSLKDVVKKQGLISNISGKEYPRCEAWTLLGTMLGVFPVCTWTKKLEDGWEARVEARTKDGCVVGAADAQCLRSEKNWHNRDDFAIRSMAQTRATAKCLRMPLGFVMTLAGYEATPAEEMVVEQTTQAPQVQKPKPKPEISKLDKFIAEAVKIAPHEQIEQFFRDLGWLAPFEVLSKMEDRFLPKTVGDMKMFKSCMNNWIAKGDTVEPYDCPIPDPKAKKTVEVPREDVDDSEEEEWRQFPMPFGKNAGTAMEDLEKNYLFGLWANYKVETEYNGKPKKSETITKDTKFREMLDQAGNHYQFKKKD